MRVLRVYSAPEMSHTYTAPQMYCMQVLAVPACRLPGLSTRTASMLLILLYAGAGRASGTKRHRGSAGP
jgi:hypothetical protein